MVKKLFASLLAIVLVVSSFLMVVYGSVEMPNTSSSTDTDEDFPLDIQPVIAPDSVRYLPVEQPLNSSYSFDPLQPDEGVGEIERPATYLDREMLSVGLSAALKSDYDYDSFELSLKEENTEIAGGTYPANQPVTVDEIELAKVYDITVKLTSSSSIEIYIGKLFCEIDIDNTVFVNVQYSHMTLPGEVQTRANVTTKNEIESNNTLSTATHVAAGQTVKGTISSFSDVDFFRYPVTAASASIEIAVSNNSSSPLSITLYYYTTSTVVRTFSVVAYGNNYLSIPSSSNNRSAGIFYVKVAPTSFSSAGNYYLNFNFTNAKTWYSQHSGNIGGVNYWNTEKLDNLYFSDYDEKELPFITNQTDNNNKVDVMDTGCFITCSAMVLRNKGKRRYCKDFRTGFLGAMYADPFTVMLANVNKSGSEITQNPSTGNYNLPGVTGNPVYTNLQTIATNFSCTRTNTTLTGMDAQKAATIANLLSSHPEGVIVTFNGAHYVVIVGDRGSSYPPANRFIVCDPGTIDPAKGNNVVFSNSHSAHRGFSSLTNAYTFN